ncbi:MAG TPA: hypothetical protein VFT29_15080 [Gemmatimonadaceae bacterium]|nr:hypothetical protein [Gemmatimonadaceae bacterium]
MSITISTNPGLHALSVARMGLTVVTALGLAGATFSGTLVYREVFASGASCPATGATIAGVPVCVYGFLMFVAITCIGVWGLVASRSRFE